MSRQTDIIMKNAQTILRNVNLSPLEGKSILLTGASGLIKVHMLACLNEPV